MQSAFCKAVEKWVFGVNYAPVVQYNANLSIHCNADGPSLYFSGVEFDLALLISALMRSEVYSTWSEVCLYICLSVCLSVCLLPRFLQPRATRQRMSDTKINLNAKYI